LSSNVNTSTDTFIYEGRDLEAMSFAPRYHDWILDHFEPYVGSNLTEIGAGTGTFSEILLHRFNRPLTMVEPSESMLNNLVNRLSEHDLWDSCSVIQGFSSTVTLPEPTDTFFYVNVLEHIEDDRRELNWMYDQLSPGGHACLFCPALPFLFGSHDEKVDHYRRYTKQELVEKTRSAGFAIEEAMYFDIPGVPLWWINFVLLRRQMDPKAVQLYDKLIVPLLRRFEPSRYLPLGKNVLVVGRKV
jgi:SAM-dependent methyltransferase